MKLKENAHKHEFLKCNVTMHMLSMKKAKNRHHRGPRGAGTSRAINPLMQMVERPSPVLRIY